jgi:hypothetical protein
MLKLDMESWTHMLIFGSTDLFDYSEVMQKEEIKQWYGEVWNMCA